MPDPLFKSAKELADRSQTTLQALIEKGLQHAISDSQSKPQSAFKLQKASVRGKTVLMSEPAHWIQLEEAHVIARTLLPKAKRQA